MRLTFLAASVALAVVAGCYSGTAVDTNRQPDPTKSVVTTTNGTDPTGTKDTTTTIAEASGLPCDVAVLIKQSCDGCHGATPSHDAPDSIVTYADLTAPSISDPSKSVAELALERMQSQSRPMPPDGNLTGDEVSILQNWVTAGMPKGSCGTAPIAQNDAGSTDPTVPADGGSNEASAPPPQSVCTSGTNDDQTQTGPTMRPGNACINCHSEQSGPDFQVGGTVYKTKYEPADCNGVDGTADDTKVLIIDANGAMRSFPVNSAGNFYGGADIAMPYRAMIVRGNSIREMHGAQSTGDCNSCHTEFGNGAPGRVMEP